MNLSLKYMIEKALMTETHNIRISLALDEIYEKLIVRPLQKAWLVKYERYRRQRGMKCTEYYCDCFADECC